MRTLKSFIALGLSYLKQNLRFLKISFYFYWHKTMLNYKTKTSFSINVFPLNLTKEITSIINNTIPLKIKIEIRNKVIIIKMQIRTICCQKSSHLFTLKTDLLPDFKI